MDIHEVELDAYKSIVEYLILVKKITLNTELQGLLYEVRTQLLNIGDQEHGEICSTIAKSKKMSQDSLKSNQNMSQIQYPSDNPLDQSTVPAMMDPSLHQLHMPHTQAQQYQQMAQNDQMMALAMQQQQPGYNPYMAAGIAQGAVSPFFGQQQMGHQVDPMMAQYGVSQYGIPQSYDQVDKSMYPR